LSLLTNRTIFLQFAEMFLAYSYCGEYPQQRLVDWRSLLFPFGITGRTPSWLFAKEFVRWQIADPPLECQGVKIGAFGEPLKDTDPFYRLWSIPVDAHRS